MLRGENLFVLFVPKNKIDDNGYISFYIWEGVKIMINLKEIVKVKKNIC